MVLLEQLVQRVLQAQLETLVLRVHQEAVDRAALFTVAWGNLKVSKPQLLPESTCKLIELLIPIPGSENELEPETQGGGDGQDLEAPLREALRLETGQSPAQLALSHLEILEELARVRKRLELVRLQLEMDMHEAHMISF